MFLNKPKFPLGQIVATPGALDALEDSDELPEVLLERHARGDWGDVCAEDQDANDMSLKQGLRLISSYTLSTGEKLWIITEADRSVTTLLRPEDY